MNDSGGFWAAAQYVYDRQGVRGFWRGNGLNVLKSSPEFAIKFGVYDYVKRQLKTSRDDGHLNNFDRFVAGAVAGVCGQSVFYPIEARICTRLATGCDRAPAPFSFRRTNARAET